MFCPAAEEATDLKCQIGISVGMGDAHDRLAIYITFTGPVLLLLFAARVLRDGSRCLHNRRSCLGLIALVRTPISDVRIHTIVRVPWVPAWA